MTLFEIVGLYVAINIVILIRLTVLVIKQRRVHSANIGHEKIETLERAIRVHGNFTESTPFALLGLFVLAGLNASPYWLHAVGAAFTTGRIMHAYGYSKKPGVSKGRYYGMVITLLTLMAIVVSIVFMIVKPHM